jgi:hypothetical protein
MNMVLRRAMFWCRRVALSYSKGTGGGMTHSAGTLKMRSGLGISTEITPMLSR